MQRAVRPRIPALIAAGLLVGLLLTAAPAAAHSFLRDAKPEVGATVERGPKRIALWFNETVEAEFADVTVTTRKGQTIRTGRPRPLAGAGDALAVRLPRRLEPGRYLVRWRVVSADSHIQSGEFRFRVLRPSEPRADDEPASPGHAGAQDSSGSAGRDAAAPMADAGAAHVARLVTITRGVATTGLLLVVGLIVFWLLAWRGPGPALARPAAVERDFVRRWQRMASVALWLTVGATVAGVVVQGAAAAGVPVGQALSAAVIEGVLATTFGKAAVGRLVLLELLAVLAVLWRDLPLFVPVRPVRAVGAAALERGVSAPRLLLLAAVVIPLMLTMSMVSHAAAATPVGLHLAADALHFAAAGAWIGGLVVLAAVAFPATRNLGAEERVRILAPPVVRFSRVAAVSVVIVVVTGTFRGIATAGGWDGLTQTGYGTALLVKLGVFAALMAFGAVNHLWAVRRIRSAAATGSSTPAMRALRHSVRVESLLAAAIVVVTAILVSQPMAAA
jgi:copper transport protein